MNGNDFAAFIENELTRQNISKGEFYSATGLTAAAMWGWKKNGATPKKETIEKVEKYLGVSFSNVEKCDPREDLRDDLRILLNSASDLPPSSVYALISQIEKMKEDAT